MTYLADLTAVLVVVLAIYGITCTDNRVGWSIATVVFLPLVGPGLAVYGLYWLGRWMKVDPLYRHGFPTRRRIQVEAVRSQAAWRLRASHRWACEHYADGSDPLDPVTGVRVSRADRTSPAKLRRKRKYQAAQDRKQQRDVEKARRAEQRRYQRDDRRLQRDIRRVSGYTVDFGDLAEPRRTDKPAGPEATPSFIQDQPADEMAPAEDSSASPVPVKDRPLLDQTTYIELPASGHPRPESERLDDTTGLPEIVVTKEEGKPVSDELTVFVLWPDGAWELDRTPNKYKYAGPLADPIYLGRDPQSGLRRFALGIEPELGSLFPASPTPP